MEPSPTAKERAEALPEVLRMVGQRLRRDRERRGVGVRELSRRIGISPSLISQIELGKANPSVGTLYQIVDELNLSLDDLLLESEDEEAARADPARPAFPSPPAAAAPAAKADLAPFGAPAPVYVQMHHDRASLRLPGVTWERLTANDDPNVDFLLVTYAPGAESCSEDQLMRHGGHEYGIVLEGRLGVRVRFQTFELGPGDSISFDSMEPHRFWTIGDEPSRSIWTVVKRRYDPRVHDERFQ